MSECKGQLCSIAPDQRLWAAASLDCGPPLINIFLLAQRWHLEQNGFPPLGPSNSFLGLKLSLILLTPAVPPTVQVCSELTG